MSKISLPSMPTIGQAATNTGKVLLQVGLLSALWLAMDALRTRFGWSMPAGLIGFALLAAGLFSGLIKTHWLQSGTNWLMAEMLLFFVPAILVVKQYPDLLISQGLSILAVILASTACVMAATALVVDRVYRIELWLARRRSSRVIRTKE